MGGKDERLQVLSEAMRAFAEATGTPGADLLQTIAQRTAEALDATCGIALASADGATLAPATLHDPDPARMDAMTRLLSSSPLRLDTAHPLARAFHAGNAVLLNEVTEEVLRARFPEPDAHAAALALRITSVLFVPVRAGGRSIGACTFVRHGPDAPPLGEDDLWLAKALADQAGLALGNAKLLSDARHELAVRERLAARLRLMGDLARDFADASHDYGTLLDLVTRRLGELHGDLCTIRFVSEDRQWLEASGHLYTPDPGQRDGLRAMMMAHPQPVGEGLVGRVAATRTPTLLAVVSPDELAAALAEPYRSTVERLGIRSVMLVPLVHRGDVLGVLSLSRARPGEPFTADDLELLQDAAGHAALAIANARLLARSSAELAQRRRMADRLQLLSELSKEFAAATDDLRALHQLVARRVCEVLGDACSIRMLSDDGAWLLVEAEHGNPLARSDRPQRLGEGLSGRAAATGVSILVPEVTPELLGANVAEVDRAMVRALPIHSVIAVPLRAAGGVIGIVGLARTTPGHPYTQDDLRLIEDLAGHASLAIANARLLAASRRDVVEATRRRELEEQNRAIREASRLKSEFLASMSHELRTPLNAIIGFTELMVGGKAGPLSATQGEYLGDVLTSARHLLQLINDVLDLSKVEAGQLKVRPEDVDLRDLVREVRAIVRGLAADKRLKLSVEVTPEVCEVSVDARLVKQVLYNYLSNAIKFTPEGGAIALRVAPEGVDAFRIDVTDSGIGIPPEHLDLLFVEFQQLDATAGTKVQGTGLGLALTRRLTEAHGGRVGSSRVDLQACKLEYSIVSPK